MRLTSVTNIIPRFTVPGQTSLLKSCEGSENSNPEPGYVLHNALTVKNSLLLDNV